MRHGGTSGSHHGPVRNNRPTVAAGGRWRPGNEAESTATAAVWGGAGRKPERVRIPFARDLAFELNTR
jgi:hypothetical protein